MKQIWADALDAYEGTVLARLLVRGSTPDRAEFRDRAASGAYGVRADGYLQSATCEWQNDSGPDPMPEELPSESCEACDAFASDDVDHAGSPEQPPLSLSALFPVPPILAKLPDDARPGWPSNYSPAELWMAEHWGTAGDIRECDVPTDDGLALCYEFLTQGGVPEPWVAAVALAFPDLECTLEYFFPEYCDAGRVTYSGPQLVERLHAPDVEAVAAFALRHFGIPCQVSATGME